MADTLVYVTTYVCPNVGNCVYSQRHDPVDSLWMSQSFHEPQYAGLPQGACPACYAGENLVKTKGLYYLEKISGPDLSSLDQSVVASDATLEATQVEVLDANGQQIMEQVGSHWELQVNQTNGAITSVEVPDYAPKMRPLTDQELADLKLQRDKSLDALESVAVSSTTATTSTDTTTPTDQPSITI